MNYKRFAWSLTVSVVIAIVAMLIPAQHAASQSLPTANIPLNTIGRIGGLARSVAVGNGVLYLGEGQSFTILQPQPSLHYRVLGPLQLPSGVSDVKVVGTIAYLSLNTMGLYVVDVARPEQPTILAQVSDLGQIVTLVVEDSDAYVASYDAGLHIFDVRDLAQPQKLSTYPTTFRGIAGGHSLQVSHGIAYILPTRTERTQPVKIVDVRNPAAQSCSQRLKMHLPTMD